LAEPLLQLGPKGLVLTVERHFAVFLYGISTALFLHLAGLNFYAKVMLGAVASFTLTVRGLIWLLMNFK
jgi:hypothetical protein